MAETGGLDGVISKAMQFAGDKIVEIAEQGAKVAIGGLGALISMIPGLGSVGESIAATGSRGETPMKDDFTPAAPATPAVARTPEVVVEKQVVVERDPVAVVKAMALPAAALAALNAERDMAPGMMQSAAGGVALSPMQNFEPLDLGVNARSGVNFGMGPSVGAGRSA